jgi:hypothetical protein
MKSIDTVLAWQAMIMCGSGLEIQPHVRRQPNPFIQKDIALL